MDVSVRGLRQAIPDWGNSLAHRLHRNPEAWPINWHWRFSGPHKLKHAELYNDEEVDLRARVPWEPPVT